MTLTHPFGMMTGAAAGGGVWDISGGSYDSKSLDVSGEMAFPQGMFFKPDGTKVFVITDSVTASVYQYSLSTAWDVSTGSYDSKSKAVNVEDTSPDDVDFSTDGTKMYILGSSSDKIHQYTLSTAWDVSTASAASKTLDISTEENNAGGMSFNEDGTKVFVVGKQNDTMYQYTLSTAWDVSTGSYDSKSKSISAEDTFPTGMFVRDDSTQAFIMGGANTNVYQYTLSTPDDISTASYDSKTFDTGTEDGSPAGLFFKPDGTKCYVLGQANKKVFQYSL